MRLATFNILHGQPVLGVDRGHPPEPTPEALSEAVETLNPDILGLQEVDWGQERSGYAHQTRSAAEAIGAAEWRFLPTVSGTPGNRGDFVATDQLLRTAVVDGRATGPMYGIGLVSRLPVISWHHAVYPAAPMALPLLVPGDRGPRLLKVPDEPRAVIAAVVKTDLGLATIATAHLSFVPGVNLRQLRMIRTWLRQFPGPTILMGDFNAPGRLPGLVTGWAELVRGASYPSFGPRVQFDHILGHGLSEAVAIAARDSAQVHALRVSDHCAVSVDVDL